MGLAKRIGRWWRAGALVAVGAAGGAAALAVASVPDSSGVIHACVNQTTTTGGVPVPDATAPNVTIIDKAAGQKCLPPDGPAAPNQTELTWSVTGPPGPPGPPGVTGARGATGAPGAAGPAGKANTVTFTLAPPVVRSTAAPLGQVTLGSGRGALNFDVLSYSLAPTGGSATGGAGAGKVRVNEIRIVKLVDQASPKLFQATSTGKHYATATLTVAKKSGGSKPFLKITLKEVLISSVQLSSGGSGGSRPQESLTLNFTSIQLQYKK